MTTPEERAAYRTGLLNRIADAKRRKIGIEIPPLEFQIAVLDEYEALLAKHEEWGGIEFRKEIK